MSINTKKEIDTPSACTSQEKGSINRDALIRKYVYLVNWVVNRLPVSSMKGYEKEDLVGYGTIGLIEAVDKYDPHRVGSFESYAMTRIRGAIYDELRSSDVLSRNSRKNVKNLSKTILDLENKLGRTPTDKEISDELAVSPEKLREIQREAQVIIFSFEDQREDSDEGGYSPCENISSGEASALEKLEEKELKDSLAKAISTLPEKEKTVIGLYHYKKLTFKEIGEVMDFSESRASQLHARAISLLKAKMVG